MSAWTRLSATSAASSSAARNPLRISTAASFSCAGLILMTAPSGLSPSAPGGKGWEVSVFDQTEGCKHALESIQLDAGDPRLELFCLLLFCVLPFDRLLQDCGTFFPIDHHDPVIIAEDQIPRMDDNPAKNSRMINQPEHGFGRSPDGKSPTEDRKSHRHNFFGVADAPIDGQSAEPSSLRGRSHQAAPISTLIMRSD